MKKLLMICLLPVFVHAFAPVQNDRNYQVNINLNTIEDNRVKVTMVTPVLQDESVIYNMPKIVPGTYKVYDFGRYVHDFKALNSLGEELEVEKLNENQWKISNAKALYKIEYWSSASYNESNSRIFAPAGSHISESVFLMNNFSFFGYLDGYNHFPYTLNVQKPSTFYGVTSLEATSRTDSADFFTAQNYFELHDCPILYAKPDTASIIVAGIPVTIGVYSELGNLDAKSIREDLTPVFESAAKYLGGNLPAEKYTVLVYGLEPRKAIRGTGALEHHTSTLMTVPDANEQMMKMFGVSGSAELFRGIVAHEFFHIVTPLNIHAQQINDFDFIKPQMSEHLWLYEGITEYNSMLSLARGGVTSLEEFVEETKTKIEYSHFYSEDVPFVQMSKYALSFYAKEYGNVYQKGALIGMALDLKLRSLSEGEFGLIDLLEKMWTVYDADTFFVDEQLFGILAQESYPEIEEFLVRHVASAEPLPLTELFAEVGITYIEERKVNKISLGKIAFYPSKQKGGLVVQDFDENHPFPKELNLKKGDVLVAWDGQKIESHDFKSMIETFINETEEGKKVTVLVLRENEKGEMEEVKLKAHAVKQIESENDILTINDNLTDKQRTLRQFWINY